MSHHLAHTLTPVLLDRLSVSRVFEHANEAIVVCSMDDDGRPHPAMLSSLELAARDAENIRFAVYAGSRTSRNLVAKGHVTLMIVGDKGAFYIKGEAQRLREALPIDPRLAAFNMRVTAVLEDNPAAHEGAAITSGIRVHRAHADEARTAALLSELLTLA